MSTQTIEITKKLARESYQLIREEQLSMIVVSSQVLSSSKILKGSYSKVVFSDCLFYGCDFNRVSFTGCIFENCIFEFTHFRSCNFINCNFTNCTWKGFSSMDCIYEVSELGAELSKICKNGRNTLLSNRKEQSTDIYIQLALAS